MLNFALHLPSVQHDSNLLRNGVLKSKTLISKNHFSRFAFQKCYDHAVKDVRCIAAPKCFLGATLHTMVPANPIPFIFLGWIVYSAVVWIWVRIAVFSEMKLLAAVFNSQDDKRAQIENATKTLPGVKGGGIFLITRILKLIFGIFSSADQSGTWEQIWPTKNGNTAQNLPESASTAGWDYTSDDLRVRFTPDDSGPIILARVPPPTPTPLRELLRARPPGGVVARTADRLGWTRWVAGMDRAAAAASADTTATDGPAPELIGEWRFSGFRSYIGAEEVAAAPLAHCPRVFVFLFVCLFVC